MFLAIRGPTPGKRRDRLEQRKQDLWPHGFPSDGLTGPFGAAISYGSLRRTQCPSPWKSVESESRSAAVSGECWKPACCCGAFPSATWPELDEAELDRFEVLLDADDNQLLDWIVGRKEAPPHIDPAVARAD